MKRVKREDDESGRQRPERRSVCTTAAVGVVVVVCLILLLISCLFLLSLLSLILSSSYLMSHALMLHEVHALILFVNSDHQCVSFSSHRSPSLTLNGWSEAVDVSASGKRGEERGKQEEREKPGKSSKLWDETVELQYSMCH